MTERYRERRARRRALTGLFLLLLGLAPAAAAEEGDDLDADHAPIHFFLEEIRVENARLARPEVVLAEARLETGREYGEDELRQALQRIVRLPLVLAAEPRLEKGSERGRYVLVIELEEAYPWFFNVDLHYEHWQPEVALATFATTQWVDSGDFLVGYRRPVGRRGVGFVALSGVEGTVNLGYTQYDVGRRGILVSGSVSFGECWVTSNRGVGPGDSGRDGCPTQVFDLGLDPTLSAWSLDERVVRGRLQVGVPLTGNHSLRLLATARNANGGRRGATFAPLRDLFDVADRRDQELSLAWVFDSTDDPIFPTRGLRAEGGVEVAALQGRLEEVRFDGNPALRSDFDSERYGAMAGVELFHTRGDDTFSLRGRAFLGRSELDGVPTGDRRLLSGSADTWSAVVGVSHSRLLWQRRQAMSWRELRWESVAELSHQGTSPSFAVDHNPLLGLRVGTALRLRTNWGLFSLRFDYLDYGG